MRSGAWPDICLGVGLNFGIYGCLISRTQLEVCE